MSGIASRTRVIYGLIFFFAVVLVLKLYFVQVVHGADYEARANRQYYNPSQGVFERGTIYFETKDGDLVEAAVNKSGYVLAINPKILKNPDDAYEKINQITPLDKTGFLSSAAKKNDPYEEVAKKIDVDSAKKIEDLKIEGVMLFQEKWRYYPGEKEGAGVLGFVGYKGDVLDGRYGLERRYESVLKKDQTDDFSNIFAEAFSGINKAVGGGNIQGDVVTTIEPSVELYLETAIQKINSKWSSKQTGGIIMNPMSGEIYAMASFPTFDPNKYQEEKNMSVFTNPLVEGVYEMGSIIKPLTMAAGIDSGAVTPETKYFDNGFLVLNGSKIQNYDGKGRGLVDMQTVLNKSLNTGAAFVSAQMGNKTFSKYMLNYGLGEKTGIDLPNEASGLVANLDTGRDIERATASYGQGIAMTPVETVRALSALGNGGNLVTPHVAKKIIYDFGLSKNLDYPTGKSVLKKETSDQITNMLVNVVDNALLNGQAKNPNYTVAAKTGTAELTKPGGGYDENRFLHTFFGYFPAYNPRFIVFLYTLDPKGVTYASETLTNSFLDISKYLISYYQIQPDR